MNGLFPSGATASDKRLLWSEDSVTFSRMKATFHVCMGRPFLVSRRILLRAFASAKTGSVVRGPMKKTRGLVLVPGWRRGIPLLRQKDKKASAVDPYVSEAGSGNA